MGPLLPTLAANGGDPNDYKFAQLYILDEQAAIQQRCRIMTDLKPAIIGCITRLIHLNNSYVQQFRGIANQARQAVAQRQPGQAPILEVDAIIDSNGAARVVLEEQQQQPHQRTYNAPRAGEVAGFMPDGHEGLPNRGIVAYRQPQAGETGAQLQIMKDTNPAYFPLRFPLLFPCGGPGWHPGQCIETIPPFQNSNW